MGDRPPPPPINLFGNSRWIRLAIARWIRERRRLEQGNLKLDNKSDDPRFSLINDFYVFCLRMIGRENLLFDRSKLFDYDFTSKRAMVTCKIDGLVSHLMSEVPAPHLRTEFANMLGFIVTIAELWKFVNMVMKVEINVGDHYFLSLPLIDKFDDFFDTMEQCRRYGHVDITQLTHVLELRDAIVSTIQHYYRVNLPLAKREKASHPKQMCGRYNPFDWEWLCGCVISGPYQLAASKYLCRSRINQMRMSQVRCLTMAVSQGIDFTFAARVKVPMPDDPKDAKLLLAALSDREFVMKDGFTKTVKYLSTAKPANRELRFTNNMEEFFYIRGDVRKKKRNIIELLKRAERREVVPLHRIVGIMSQVEAHLLLLHKVYALYVESEFGMFGKALPRNVYKLILQIYLTTTFRNCELMDAEITDVVEKLRVEVHHAIRRFIRLYEDRCEKNFLRNIDLNTFLPDNSVYPMKAEDFPEELALYFKSMQDSLVREQIEIHRLHFQYSQARRSYFQWPSTHPPATLNALNKGLDGIYSNFVDLMPIEAIAEALSAVLPTKQKLDGEFHIGGDVLKAARQVMAEARCYPSATEINQGFLLEFREVLGKRMIEDMNAEDLAEQFGDIINSDIEISGIKQNLRSSRGNGNGIARKVAKQVVKVFLEHLKSKGNYEEAAPNNNNNTKTLTKKARKAANRRARQNAAAAAAARQRSAAQNGESSSSSYALQSFHDQVQDATEADLYDDDCYVEPEIETEDEEELGRSQMFTDEHSAELIAKFDYLASLSADEDEEISDEDGEIEEEEIDVV